MNWKRFAALSCSIVFSLFLLEMGARILYFGIPGAFSPTKLNSWTDIGSVGVIRQSQIPELKFELKPNVDVMFKLARLRTNSAGMADDEYPLEKPARTVRVAVLGDSFAMPSGVRLEDAFHSILERRLSDANRRVELLNFGVGGYDLRQYATVLKHRALAYHPDAILLSFCGWNDHEIRPERFYQKPLIDEPLRHNFWHSFALLGLDHLMHAKKPAPQAYTPEEVAYMQRMFTQIAQLASEQHLPVLVAFLSITQGDPDTIQRLAEGAGLHFVDASKPLVHEDIRRLVIHRLDAHPNASVHARFAEQIEPALRPLLPAVAQ